MQISNKCDYGGKIMQVNSDNYARVVNNLISCYKTNSDLYVSDYSLATLSRDLHAAHRCGFLTYGDSNVFVIREQADAERIVKLSTILPDPLSITFGECTAHTIDKEFDFCNPKNGAVSEYDVYCHLPQLDYPRWFQESLPLLQNGLLKYYPNVFYEEINSSGHTLIKYDHFSASRLTWDTNYNINNYVNKILTLEIPYFYDVPLEKYIDVVFENRDSLNTFRRYFDKEIVNVDLCQRNELIDFEYELNRQVSSITNLYKSECLKLIKGLTIGTLSTITAVMLAFSSADKLIEAIIGASGAAGLIPALTNFIDFNISKMRLKSKDLYFLWLLRN